MAVLREYLVSLSLSCYVLVCSDETHLEAVYLPVFHSFKGFMQVYQLQTENDEEETWRDLVSDVFFCVYETTSHT